MTKITRSFLSFRKLILRSNTKKAKKEAKARKRIAELHSKLNNLGPHLEVATDGSSIPNPGPTGAGYVLREVGYGANDYAYFSSISLGHGTNNLGELEALKAALTQVISDPPPTNVPIVFLIDSQFALNIANSVHHSRAYPELAYDVARLRLTLQGTHRTILEWTPAHFDFAINEVADDLAKRGAAGETSLDPPDVISQDRANSPPTSALAPSPSVTPPRPRRRRLSPPSDIDPGPDASRSDSLIMTALEGEPDESSDSDILRDLFSLGTLDSPRPDLTCPDPQPAAAYCISSDDEVHQDITPHPRQPSSHQRSLNSCISSDEEDAEEVTDSTPVISPPADVLAPAPSSSPVSTHSGILPLRRSSRKRNHVRTFTQIDFSMSCNPVRRSQKVQPTSTLRNWLASDAYRTTEPHADPNVGNSSRSSEATRPSHPTSAVHLAGDEEEGGSEDDLTKGDPLIPSDRDSQEEDTDRDGDAGPGGRSSTGGGTYYTTSSGDILPRRMGGTHSIPDQKATGQEAAPGACALDTAEMPCHKTARTHSLPISSATHSTLPMSASTSLPSSAYSPPLSSLQYIRNPSPRSKPYDMSENRDVLDEDGYDADGDTADYYTDANDEDVGEDGDDEEDSDEARYDGDYVDEDDGDMT